MLKIKTVFENDESKLIYNYLDT
eukprot:SAG22_NODE_9775_length_570_cov_0.932059_1_plen_22_part_01